MSVDSVAGNIVVVEATSRLGRLNIGLFVSPLLIWGKCQGDFLLSNTKILSPK